MSNQLREELVRNQRAADALDSAVKEMLGR